MCQHHYDKAEQILNKIILESKSMDSSILVRSYLALVEITLALYRINGESHEVLSPVCLLTLVAAAALRSLLHPDRIGDHQVSSISPRFLAETPFPRSSETASPSTTTSIARATSSSWAA